MFKISLAMVILALSRLVLNIAHAYRIIKKANHDYNNRN
ncbi:hypothetical protein B6U53_07620 [Ligilactobacillus salivarius]|uniref:Uncharacterized protein n=2 Tax=Ligilactobacillus salivarius TaxID=1624 RepID=A0JQS9_LIGS1|nr:Hypothetical protein, phage associated [Ligilactobacillus salivarius UCC118]MBC6927075.1 hypothetical protein [Ligilactobacillus salivarius]MSE08563.1 hypothetical protein [Ligilactobacillus salivarius]MYU79914.1 hypothetical protein [Ligilactobacillus salivarius]MYV08109.1 hypothetical protein [Ligilactobacillus salivarius]